ncbi:TetR/AcrR family transcriptional regulator [Actinospica durhamensis]|uniref:TetR/AcrR family transcriptional regulator n=1 Tax=Actinospica durhamensis TaxID=1508375 RepID=A0A941IQJ7_9ACTN|nr:TetR/AcrR family transcriptional regulator [Actinospica durhamensis]MBR7837735.1 TetR/AcrR family transcriptional regulator [Actinospica durhamensis]
MSTPTEAPASSPRRAELLERTLEYAARTSLSELSLRPLAAEIGSSPRVLIYLFGSKEGLLREVLAASRAQQLAVVQAALAEEASPREAIRRLWEWMCDPEHRGLARLFMEAYSRSLGGGEPWVGFAADSVHDWLPALRRMHAAPGAPAPTDAQVTVTLAVLRGLLYDLLSGAGEERVIAAMDFYLETTFGPRSGH